MAIFCVPPCTGGGGGGGGLPPPAGPTSGFFRYTAGGGVGPGGTQYLQLGNAVFSSEAGDLLTADGTLIGISFSLDVLDAGRDYLIEVLTDPSGAGGTGPTVIGTLAIPTGTLRGRTRALSTAVAGLLDMGVRLVRTSGGGGSTFTEVVVTVEVSIP